MGLGGAVPKGDVSLRYLNDARASPSTCHSNMIGRGEGKGRVDWGVCSMKPRAKARGESGMPHPGGGSIIASCSVLAPELKGGNAGLDATPRGLSP